MLWLKGWESCFLFYIPSFSFKFFPTEGLCLKMMERCLLWSISAQIIDKGTCLGDWRLLFLFFRILAWEGENRISLASLLYKKSAHLIVSKIHLIFYNILGPLENTGTYKAYILGGKQDPQMRAVQNTCRKRLLKNWDGQRIFQWGIW